MFLIFTRHKTRTFTVRLAVTTKYQGNGFAAEVLLVRDYPRVVPVGPIVRRVIVFPIFWTWWDATTQVASQSVNLQASYGISNTFQQRPSANFYYLVTVVQICCCIPNVIKIGSHVLNVQSSVARPRPLPRQPHFGKHVGNVMGCDQPSFVPIGPFLSELWYANIFQHGAVRHSEF